MNRIVRLANAGVMAGVLATGTLVLTTAAASANPQAQPVASQSVDVQNRKAQIEYRERLELQSIHPTGAQIEHPEQS